MLFPKIYIYVFLHARKILVSDVWCVVCTLRIRKDRIIDVRTQHNFKLCLILYCI